MESGGFFVAMPKCAASRPVILTLLNWQSAALGKKIFIGFGFNLNSKFGSFQMMEICHSFQQK